MGVQGPKIVRRSDARGRHWGGVRRSPRDKTEIALTCHPIPKTSLATGMNETSGQTFFPPPSFPRERTSRVFERTYTRNDATRNRNERDGLNLARATSGSMVLYFGTDEIEGKVVMEEEEEEEGSPCPGFEGSAKWPYVNKSRSIYPTLGNTWNDFT